MGPVQEQMIQESTNWPAWISAGAAFLTALVAVLGLVWRSRRHRHKS